MSDFRQETVEVKVVKNFYMDEPSHWSVEVTGIDGVPIGLATAPTFAGIWDVAWELITGDDSSFDSQHNEWVDFDANNKERTNGK